MATDLVGLAVASIVMMLIGFLVYRRLDARARRIGTVGTY